MSTTRSNPTQVQGYTNAYSQNPRLLGYSWKQVAYGENFVLAINNVNKLYGWGRNDLGQLGTNDTVNRSSPTQLGTDNWTSIDITQSTVAAIRSDYLLFTWGYNAFGQLGLSDSVNRSSPTQVSTSSWTSVASGASHLMAIRSDGTLWATGDNAYGQLGIIDYNPRSSLTQVSSGGSWSAVSAGINFTAAIDNTGKLFTFGNDDTGQLGTSGITSSLFSWTTIAGNDDFTVAIRQDGLLFGWGLNTTGQLGLSDTLYRSSPVQIGTNSWTFVSVNGDGAGASVSAIRDDGTLWSWGSGVSGLIGDNTTINRSSPVQVAGGGSWTTVSAGKSHKLAIKSDGGLYAWGLNTSGQLGNYGQSFIMLGNGSSGYYVAKSDNTFWSAGPQTYGQFGLNNNLNYSSPVQIGGGARSWNLIRSGSYNLHGGIDATGSLWTWGQNNAGQAGVGTTITRSSPVQITTPATTGWTDFSPAISHAGAINAGRLYMWGFNGFGELGIGLTTNRSNPVQVTAVSESWIQVSSSDYRTHGITQSGKLYGWGASFLGTGDANLYSTPVQITSPSVSWIQVSNGSGATFGITTDYQLYAVGVNSDGRLGVGDTVNKSAFTQIPGSWLQVAAHTDGSCVVALKSDNTVWAWGYNPNGGLTGDSVNRSSPTQIFSGSDRTFSRVAIGAGSSVFALDNYGMLWISSGSNSFGYFGDNSTTAKSTPIVLQASNASLSSPVQIGLGLGGPYSWSNVNAGDIFSTAIQSTGSLWTWGANAAGQLGLGDTISRSSITQIGASSWTNVYASASWVHAITSDNRLHAWGLGTTAQLGYGDALSRSSPVQVSVSKFTSVAGYATTPQTAALDINYNLWMWGSKTNKLLGEFSNASYTYSWSNISAGLSHTVAVRNDGRLYGWGLNTSGQLGLSDTINRSSPTQIGALTGGQGEYWLTAAVGGNRTYAIRGDNTLWGWGDNSFYGLGLISDSINRSSPTQISAGSWSTLSVGTSHVMATDSTKKLYVWGNNTFGQLGLSDTFNRSSPTQLGTSSWTMISAGGSHSTAIDATNKLYTWGSNDSGQLSQNDTINRSSPTQVTTSSYTVVTAGDKHTLFIDSQYRLFGAGNNQSFQVGVTASTNLVKLNNINTGFVKSNDYSLWLWGSNDVGQLGINSVANRSSPTQVGTVESFTVVARAQVATVGHTLAIRNDGSLYAWGSGVAGKLGLNDTLNRSSPVQVGTSSWLQVAAGVSHSLAIKSDGSLWGWGLNTSGQVGMLSWTQVSSGNSHTIALRSDGQLFAYGLNSSGQLGLSDTLNRSSPVQIGSGVVYTKIAAGQNFSAAIRSDSTMWVWGSNANGVLGLANTLNRSSPVQLTTPIPGSALIGTSGSGQTYNMSPGANTTAGDFTVECWAMRSAVNTFNCVACFSGAGDAIFRLSAGAVGVGSIFWSFSSYTYTTGTNTDGNTFAAANTWFHMAIVRSGSASNNVSLYVNGQLIQQASSTVSKNLTAIGYYNNATSQEWNGYISNLRVSNNARYSGSSFTPPTSPFTVDSNTVFLGFTTSVAAYDLVGVQAITGTATQSTVVPPAYSPTPTAQYSFTQVTASDFLLAYTTNNGLWSIGRNNNGQLGLNDTISRSILFQIGTNDTSSALAINAGTIGAKINNNGSLFTWGLNSTGQLGLNNTINRSSPVQLGTDSWSTISSGSDGHTLAIRSNGSLYAWGLNNAGQLGNGLGDITYYANRSSPIQIGTTLSWSTVYAGASYSMAKATDGTLYAWGSNLYNQAGLATFLSWTQLGAPNTKSGDGKIWIAGNNTNGELGDSSTIARSSPTQVGTSSWNYVASSDNTRFGIEVDGTLYAWGLNTNGRLGLSDTISRSSPVQIGTGSWSVVVASNTGHSLAIKSDGTLWAWGVNTYGELGVQDSQVNINRSSPTQIGAGSWRNIAVGNNFSLGIDTNYKLYSWGRNDQGQLGLTDTVASLSWTQISNGLSHSMALRNDGRLYVWGLNSSGQLGLNDTLNRSSPVQVTTGTPVAYSWSQIAAGTTHTAAIATDGTLWAWGFNASGQLGLNDTIARSNPTQVAGSFNLVQAGLDATYILQSGSLFVTGLNSKGQLGLTDTIARSSPVQVGTSSWSAISASAAGHVLGLINGSLYAWGDNAYNQLGLESDKNLAITAFNRSSPVQVGTDTNWSKISAGVSYSTAIKTTGALFTWGLNNIGQLGYFSNPTLTSYGLGFAIRTDNRLYVWGSTAALVTATRRSSPVQVQTGAASFTQLASRMSYVDGIGTDGQLYNCYADSSNSTPTETGSWNTISAGYSHIIAVKNDYTVWAKGLNNAGQLGDNTTTNRSAYVQVLLPTKSWVKVSAGHSFSAAVASDGSLFTWGSNLEGQLGTGDKINRSSPTQIGTSGDGWTDVSMGFAFGMGRRTGGTLWVWGRGTSGEMGNSTVIGRSSPIQVGTSSWSFIAAGNVMLGISAFRLYGWGSNVNGACGIGLTTARSSPIQVGTSSWVGVWADNRDGYAIGATTASTVFGWGINSAGQLGDNTTLNRSAPVQVLLPSLTGALVDIYKSPTQVGTSSWTAVNAGNSWTAAIRTDGGLFTWGLNDAGQLGSSTTLNRSSPVQLGTLSWSQISGKYNNPIAITSAYGIFTWGYNLNAQIGDNTTVSKSSPVSISGSNATTGITAGIIDSVKSPTAVGTSSWIAVAAGDAHAGAVTSIYTLYTWGKNDLGQLGGSAAAGSTITRSSPVQITSGTGSWSQITAGNSIMAGIATTGALYAWGYGALGATGLATTINRSLPTQIGASSWSQVSAGASYIYAADSGYRLYAWGSNNNGQLGLADTLNRSSPVQLGNAYATTLFTPTLVTLTAPPTNSYYVLLNGTTDAISTPGNSAFAIPTNTTPFTVECWVYITGGTQQYIFNEGYTGASNTVAMLVGFNAGGTSAADSAGLYPVLGYFTGGTWVRQAGSTTAIDLFNWHHIAWVFSGNNTYIFLDGVNVTASGAATTWGGALNTNGDAWYIGRRWDAVGQAYNSGYISNFRFVKGQALYTSNFTPSTSPLTTTSQGATASNVVLLTCQSNVFVDNSLNALPLTPIGSPTFYKTTTSWVSVGTGDTQAELVNGVGILWGAGVNAVGQLGDTTTVARSTAVQIGFATLYDTRSSPAQIDSGSWSYVTAGQDYSAGIKTDGTLWSWGINTNGYLGDGTTILSRSPRQIAGSYTWLESGGSHLVAIRTDGSLWTWGLNNAGQLGISDTINRSSPVQVGTSSWSTVSAGNSHTVGLDSSQNPYAWGLNSSGQLGVNDTVSRSSPVQVTRNEVYYSISFNGSSDYLSVANNAAFAFGTGDFTVEMWIYTTVTPGAVGSQLWDNRPASTNGAYLLMYVASNLTVRVWVNSADRITGAVTSLNTWYHVAVVRNSGTTTLYLNGVSQGTWSDSTTYLQGAAYIGASYAASPSITAFYGGYISNLRVVKGTAVYTSAFTPSTTPLTTTSQGVTASNVSLLTAQSVAFIDNSTNNFALSIVGNPTISTVAPFSSVVTGTSFDYIEAGPLNSIGARSYTLYVWGSATNGQLGDGTTVAKSAATAAGLLYTAPATVSSPTQIATYSNKSWSSVETGFSHTVAVATDYSLFVWGANPVGQLGDGTTVTKSSPTQLTTNTVTFTQISAGNNYTGYINSSTALMTWAGVNNTGQLGTADTLNRSSPTQVFAGTMTSPLIPIKLNTVSSSSFTMIQNGQAFTAIKNDGLLFTWGTNTNGQIGIADTISRSSPVQVGGQSFSYTGSPVQLLGSWNLISAGYTHAAAINTSYKLFTWGKGTTGALGTSDTISRSSPVQVGTSSWTLIASGNDVSMAVDPSAIVFAWGDNTNYKLGIVTAYSTQYVSSPVALTLPRKVSSVSVGSTGGAGIYSTESSQTVPGVPTITSVQSGSATSVIVNFTAPSTDGNSTILAYTAVSNPGNISNTVYQSNSGSITVFGLTPGTPYTFTVYATNAIGDSSSSSASNSITL